MWLSCGIGGQARAAEWQWQYDVARPKNTALLAGRVGTFAGISVHFFSAGPAPIRPLAWELFDLDGSPDYYAAEKECRGALAWFQVLHDRP